MEDFKAGDGEYWVCHDCGDTIKAGGTVTIEFDRVSCYACRVGGIGFGRVPEGSGLNMSVRAERDMHKRMANEAGHEWVKH